MPSFEKMAGTITAIVPIMHLITCGIYMAGYSAAFGQNIGGMFSASDFFTITIQKLISTYVLSLLFPVLVIVWRSRSSTPYAIDSVMAESDEVRRTSRLSRLATIRSIIGFACISMGVAGVSLLIAETLAGAIRDYYLAFSLINVSLFPLWISLSSKSSIPNLTSEVIWALLTFVIGVFGLGMNTGELDRYLPYKAFIDQRMICQKHLILSPVGDRFISVTPDDQRHLIDDDCKVQFDFAKTPGVPTLSTYEVLRQKWNVRFADPIK